MPETGEMKNVALDKIEIGKIALRGPELEDEQFVGLRNSIKMMGILHNLIVCESPINPGMYRLIDGLQRYTIACELNLPTVPVKVIDANEMKVMMTQIQNNIHHVTTKPAAYGKQLRRMLSLDPSLTTSSMAKMLGTTSAWILQRMNLHKLLQEIQDRVDAGEISALNAFALAKLPPNEQKDWEERAATQTSDVFVDACNARVQEIKTATREGRKAEEEKFVAPSHLRSITEIRTEHDTHTVRATQVSPKTSNLDAWDAAIQWVLHLDKASVQVAKEKWEAHKKEKAEADAKKAADRAAAKAAKEAGEVKTAADVRAELAGEKR